MSDYSNIPELSAQQAGILRRQKIAELIQAQSMKPLESQQIPNGYVVPTSPLLGIGKVLEAYLGRKAGESADTAELGLTDKYNQMEADAVKNYKTKFADKVNPYPVNDQMSPAAQQFAQTEGQQITPGDKRGAIIDALTSPFKGLNVAGTMDMKAMEAEANDKRDALTRADAAKIAQETALEKQRMHDETLRALAGNRVDAQQEKKIEQAKTKEEAKSGFESSLDALEAKYMELDKLGGIVNPENSAMSNVGARLSSSAVGQAVGGTFGTDEQSIRNEIQGTIPLLVLDIKNLTGASAQQMNSNVELQNFLKAASSPTSDVRANLQLLKNLRKKYLGGGETSTPSTTPKEESWVRDANGKLVKQ